MSRLTSNDARGLVEAYQAVYAPQELTEEQVWEEVETWVNSLLEEGYDLSDYTWEEMYEAYLEEAPARNYGDPNVDLLNKEKATRSTAQRQVQTALGQGKGIDVRGATSGAAQGRGFGAVSGGRQGVVVNKPLNPGETQQINVGGRTLFPAKSGNRTVYLPSKDAKPATPLFKSSTKPVPSVDKDKPVPSVDKDKPVPPTRTPAATTARPAAAPAAATPSAKPAMGPTGKPLVGGIERRTPTRAEMDAAKAARSAPPRNGFGVSAAPIAAKASVSTATASPKPAAAPAPTPAAAPAPKPSPSATGSKKPGSVFSHFDPFDVIKGHLLDEGYADTEESALAIMANMSEEWRVSILNEGDNYDKNRKRAAQRAAERNAARDRGQTGNVPGVGYVTPRREGETYRDAAGTERHKTGARMPSKDKKDN